MPLVRSASNDGFLGRASSYRCEGPSVAVLVPTAPVGQRAKDRSLGGEEELDNRFRNHPQGDEAVDGEGRALMMQLQQCDL